MLSTDKLLRQAQRGLFNASPEHGIFVTITFKPELDDDKPEFKPVIIKKVRDIIHYANQLETDSLGPCSKGTRALVGFDPLKWKSWSPDDPKLTNIQLRPNSNFLIETSNKFLNTTGDLFFYLKSDVARHVNKLLYRVRENFKKFAGNFFVVHSAPTSGLILGNAFKDGLANANDTIGLSTYAVVGNESTRGYGGATYLMAQMCELNWTILGSMTRPMKEDMIGRKIIDSSVIPIPIDRSHMKCAHFISPSTPIDVRKAHRPIHRQSLPYGTSDTGPGREKGIYYISIANTITAFKDILTEIDGTHSDCPGGVVVDQLMHVVSTCQGTWWYIPSMAELYLPPACRPEVEIQDHWDVHSNNDFMFYNQKEYMCRMTTGNYRSGDGPSERVLRLLDYTFQKWNDGWFVKKTIPVIPHLEDVLPVDMTEQIMSSSVAIRKSWAIKCSLGQVFTTSKREEMESDKFYGRKADIFNIHPDDILAGNMPNYSLGIGKRVMPYLRENERMPAFLKGLSEAAAIGHVVPDFQHVLEIGIDNLIMEITASLQESMDTEEQDFLMSAVLALEGVQQYMKNFSSLASHMANEAAYDFTDEQRNNLKNIAKRMETLSQYPPSTFLEAAQLVFTLHCCLHLVGEPTAIGRLDQLLGTFYNPKDESGAQDVIDSFWIKLGDRVRINRHTIVDNSDWGMTAVPYSSTGQFAKGDCINQWVQQVTIGGYLANDDKEHVSGCNGVTLLCLKAARRLPLNAPCLSLRMHKDMPEDVLTEAAQALLSGGGHPILPHDDRMIPGLLTIGTDTVPMKLADARNYACDGCYEPMISGASEFAFMYLNMLNVLEMAINEGALYSQAGPVYLGRGLPSSMPTRPPTEITSFKMVKDLFAYHLAIQIESTLHFVLGNYGNLWSVCPSPLLSSMLKGCRETKRDLTNAGAQYKLIALMHIGFANVVDSLYTIKKLCFDQATGLLSLADMVTCLKCDWGYEMKEPFHDVVAGNIRSMEAADFYEKLRSTCLSFPKFGTVEGAANSEIQEIAKWLATLVSTTMVKVMREAPTGSPMRKLLDDYKDKYSLPDAPFELMVTPGSGTFEGYVGLAVGTGASADGRRNHAPMATDMSAAPTPSDQNCATKYTELYGYVMIVG